MGTKRKKNIILDSHQLALTVRIEGAQGGLYACGQSMTNNCITQAARNGCHCPAGPLGVRTLAPV